MKAIKNVRLRDYDYSEDGYYFVTICTDFKRPCLTGWNKKIVTLSIEQLPHQIDGLSLDYYQVMPTHLRLILILEDCGTTLGEIVRRLKAATTRKAGLKLWQPNYYEHVIRDEKALNTIREYVQNNPLVEKLQLPL